MAIKIYRFLSNRGFGKFIPKKLMFKIHKLVLKLSKDVVKIKFNDRIMYVAKDYSHDFVFRKKTLEEETVRLFLDISKNYDLFVDVGACFGYYTMLSEAKNNVAIEPDKFNFSLLKKTITENKMENTTFHDYAIAGKSEERTFYRTVGKTTHSLRRESIDKEEKELMEQDTINAITLDELLEQYLGQKMLFKIDIEGLEAEAFQGMRKLFQTKNIDIIVEYNNARYNEEDVSIIVDAIKDFDITYLGIFKEETKKITIDDLLKMEDKYFNLFLQQRKNEKK